MHVVSEVGIEQVKLQCTGAMSREIFGHNRSCSKVQPVKVRDDPKLLDDGGEIPNLEEKGWQFNSRL